MIGLIRYDKIENRLEQIGLKLKALGIYFFKVSKWKENFVLIAELIHLHILVNKSALKFLGGS